MPTKSEAERRHREYYQKTLGEEDRQQREHMIEDPTYTLTYDEALCLLARAVSLKYDLKQNTFAATTRIVNTLEGSRVDSIVLRFYDEERKIGCR